MFTPFFQRVLLLLSVPVMMLFFTACDGLGIKGNGDLITEIRDEQDFHILDIAVPGTIEVLRGNTYKIEIQIEESLLPYLETEVRNGRLDVYFSRTVRDVDNLRITITAPDLDGFHLSGSAELIAFDSLSGNKLDLDISGSGEIDLKKINFHHIDAEVSGSGSIRLQGIATNLQLDLSGGGDLHALDCPVQHADLQVSGSGSVRCNVSSTLKARVSGSGDVFYLGNPVLDIDISGSGKVKKL